MSDIQVTPQGNLNGITAYCPVLDTTNHLISVVCSPAPSANVTFNVLVDVTTQ